MSDVQENLARGCRGPSRVPALIDKTDRQLVSNAAVKMLHEEPPLPGSPTEIAFDDFDSEAFFEDDVEGGFSDDDGSVQLSVAIDDAAPTVDDSDDKQSQENAGKKTTTASDGNVAQADPKQPSAQTTKVTLSIDAQPHEQFVAALVDDMPAVEAVSTAMSDPALAPFVVHAFYCRCRARGPLRSRTNSRILLSWRGSS